MSDEYGKPIIADKKPIIMALEAGKHYWCACGRSQNQPFCDGSHGLSGISPLVFEVEERKQKAALCTCKHTNTPPYCDGSHKKL